MLMNAKLLPLHENPRTLISRKHVTAYICYSQSFCNKTMCLALCYDYCFIYIINNKELRIFLKQVINEFSNCWML